MKSFKIYYVLLFLSILAIFACCSNSTETQVLENDTLLVSNKIVEDIIKSNTSKNITYLKTDKIKNWNQFVILNTYQNLEIFEDSLNVDLSMIKNQYLQGTDHFLLIGFLNSKKECIRFAEINFCPYDFSNLNKYKVYSDTTLLKLTKNYSMDSCFYVQIYYKK